MGMTGYAGKRPQWRAEERALAEAGLPDPYEDYDERSWDFLKGRQLKKLKDGKRKFNKRRSRRQRRGSWRSLWPPTAGRLNLVERGTY
jgi:hypothetical protein